MVLQTIRTTRHCTHSCMKATWYLEFEYTQAPLGHTSRIDSDGFSTSDMILTSTSMLLWYFVLNFIILPLGI